MARQTDHQMRRGGKHGTRLGYSEKPTITNSAISNNEAEAGNGGGLCFPDSVVMDDEFNIRNCTFYKNTAQRGGGIFVDGQFSGATDLKIYNSTIAVNRATEDQVEYDGGGIGFDHFESGDLVYLHITIVAKNTTDNPTTDSGPDIGGVGDVTAIHSLIGIADDGGWTLIGSSNNKNGTLSSPKNPGFATDLKGNVIFANNGGPTKTIALHYGSIAVGNGDNPLGLESDQRDQEGGTIYFPRVVGKYADIGAFETNIGDLDE